MPQCIHPVVSNLRLAQQLGMNTLVRTCFWYIRTYAVRSDIPGGYVHTQLQDTMAVFKTNEFTLLPSEYQVPMGILTF